MARVPGRVVLPASGDPEFAAGGCMPESVAGQVHNHLLDCALVRGNLQAVQCLIQGDDDASLARYRLDKVEAVAQYRGKLQPHHLRRAQAVEAQYVVHNPGKRANARLNVRDPFALYPSRSSIRWENNFMSASGFLISWGQNGRHLRQRDLVTRRYPFLFQLLVGSNIRKIRMARSGVSP